MKSFKHHFWIESEDIVFNRIMERMGLYPYNRLVEFFRVMPPMQMGVRPWSRDSRTVSAMVVQYVAMRLA